MRAAQGVGGQVAVSQGHGNPGRGEQCPARRCSCHCISIPHLLLLLLLSPFPLPTSFHLFGIRFIYLLPFFSLKCIFMPLLFWFALKVPIDCGMLFVFLDLRRHPRAVLRHEGAVQSWRRLPQDQLSLPRGFRRSWLLLRRNFFAPPCPQSNQPLSASLFSISISFVFFSFRIKLKNQLVLVIAMFLHYPRLESVKADLLMLEIWTISSPSQ